MTESGSMRESDRLKGLSSYFVWSVKTQTNLRVDGHWLITKTKQSPQAYPLTISGKVYDSVESLDEKKAMVCRVLFNSISDELINMVADHTDPVDV